MSLGRLLTTSRTGLCLRIKVALHHHHVRRARAGERAGDVQRPVLGIVGNLPDADLRAGEHLHLLRPGAAAAYQAANELVGHDATQRESARVLHYVGGQALRNTHHDIDTSGLDGHTSSSVAEGKGCLRLDDARGRRPGRKPLLFAEQLDLLVDLSQDKLQRLLGADDGHQLLCPRPRADGLADEDLRPAGLPDLLDRGAALSDDTTDCSSWDQRPELQLTIVANGL
mmetsp:Transcript_34727/g.78511  ORF Transcript_34727/g.78511 Transcript_34727/m.78511 type:complete len:227 (+) Transcript_34727:198-878(+)